MTDESTPEVFITDFDHNLPDELQKLANLMLPHRIYSSAFQMGYEVSEIEVSFLLGSMIDAAVWGAENSAWVLDFKGTRDAAEVESDEDDDFDDFPEGRMQ
jgi:hypothetical protein